MTQTNTSANVAAKQKFYALARSRKGVPTIYVQWHVAKQHIEGFPGAVHKAFPTRESAQEWLDAQIRAGLTDKPGKKKASRRKSQQLQSGIVEFTPQGSRQLDQQTSPAAEPAPVVLNEEQQQILNAVLRGQSLFLTGAGGTGKSVLLREIIKALRAKYPEKGEVAICASTGIAAVNISGKTLHSWAGLGIAARPANELYQMLMSVQSTHAPKRWKNTKVLLVDEASMISGEFLTKLEQIARAVRKSTEPFGGIQVVFCGDFFQLPPVPDSNSVNNTLAFESPAWPRLFPKMYSLKTIFRQADPTFVRVLNEMRRGELSEDSIRILKSLDRPVQYDDGISPVELYPVRTQVDAANSTRLAQLPGPAHKYKSNDRHGTYLRSNTTMSASEKADALRKLLDQSTIAASEVTLCRGAQVMLLKNLANSSLVNGSLGRVVGFQSTSSELDYSQHDPTRIPLEVAQAEKPLRADKEEVSRAEHQSGSSDYPIVYFPSTGQTLLLPPMEFSVESASGTIEAIRHQIPLVAAYALSVHKSQGQTLDRVKVDLQRTFEKGQAYVALSRATSLDRLEVQNLDPVKVMAHPKVIEWHRKHFEPESED